MLEALWFSGLGPAGTSTPWLTVPLRWNELWPAPSSRPALNEELPSHPRKSTERRDHQDPHLVVCRVRRKLQRQKIEANPQVGDHHQDAREQARRGELQSLLA